MRIYMLVYLVWIIRFNSWYKHGMGKTRFKNLEFSLWITLMADTQFIHYNDVIMSSMASQITSLTSVHSTVYSRCRSKKTSKLRVTGLCAGNSPVAGEFPAQRSSNAENVSILVTSLWCCAMIIFLWYHSHTRLNMVVAAAWWRGDVRRPAGVYIGNAPGLKP